MITALRRWRERRVLMVAEERERRRLLAEAEEQHRLFSSYHSSAWRSTNSTWSHPFPTAEDHRRGADLYRWADEALGKYHALRRQANAPRVARLHAEARAEEERASCVLREGTRAFEAGDDGACDRAESAASRHWRRARTLHKEAHDLEWGF